MLACWRRCAANGWHTIPGAIARVRNFADAIALSGRFNCDSSPYRAAAGELIQRKTEESFDKVMVVDGHVIDGKSNLNAARDIAIKNGKIAAVAANIASSNAAKTIDASGARGLTPTFAHR